MLRLIYGTAGTGKTSAIIEEIRDAVSRGLGRRLLIVPEQYSHEAERELCAACGDSLSLYGEVLSFTGLARRLRAQLGGGAGLSLDKGGRLLCMALALDRVAPRLRVYGAARGRAERQASLLAAMDEMKTALIGPEELEAGARRCGGALGDKLMDLALIMESYEAVVAQGRADPTDRLSLLASQIPQSGLGPEDHIYVDGFTDFTAQEEQVLLELMKKGVQLCLCMTIDSLYGENEVFALSRRACRRLLAQAKALSLETRLEAVEQGGVRDEALSYFAGKLFDYSAAPFPGAAPISLCRCDSMMAECEWAAGRVLKLVREKGLRWRDVALAARGFEDYRGLLESVFRHYGIPLFTAGKSPMLSKPLPALIAGAYEIIEGGWDSDQLISYLGTGLTGLEEPRRDELSAYIFRWQPSAAAWSAEDDWRQHPAGYGAAWDEKSEALLRRINESRRVIARPLLRFQQAARASRSARGQAAALSAFLAELELPLRLQSRAAALEERGLEKQAAEYGQLWGLIVSALEQSGEILGDMELDMPGFSRLFSLMLSKYELGAIPVALDRVSAGDLDRMRRRSIKELIILGCGDDRLPSAGEETGLFSPEERQRLFEAGIELGAGEHELWREFSLIYNCLSLPSEGLSLSMSLSGGEGEEIQPSFVFTRARELFGLEAPMARLDRARAMAEGPALGLAATGLYGGEPLARAAAEYFKRERPESFALLKTAADMGRGSLSPAGVEALYGKDPRLSASRIDRFASCKFSYFCRYGLRAKPFEPAEFRPPEMGVFMHYVLENTARELKARGSFKGLQDQEVKALARRFTEEFIHRELDDLREKSPRFVHLFKRLCRDVEAVTLDTVQELGRSDFEPLAFELDLSQALDLNGAGEELKLGGVADRVDGWVQGDKIYLRVVDYKTGKKKFSLSQVWYGMDLQLLMYLFMLTDRGTDSQGREIVPGGVMYLPARESLISMPGPPGEGEAESARLDSKRRSGLVLDDESLIEAWERGGDKRYIPLKTKGGRPAGDSLASLERLGLLAGHIKGCLRDMAGELRRGNLAADPYYRSQQENACLNCDYRAACYFEDGENGESSRYMPRLRDDRVWGMLEGEKLSE